MLGPLSTEITEALALTGQWYPARLQGVVLGIAGAGNISVVIDFLFAPKIAELWLVGCAGGLGGTALIKTLGYSKESFGRYMEGFLIFAFIVLVAIVGLSIVKKRWREAGGRI